MTEPEAGDDAVADARARAGRAIRDLGQAFVGHQASIADLDALTGDLSTWAARLDTGTRRNRALERPTGDWGPAPDDGREMTSYDDRPISGRSSPYGLDVRVVREGDEVVAHVTLGAAHEGAPGRSHGGIVSALFDDIYGFVLTVHGTPGFTGELSVRYEVGVPLHQPLECRVRLADRDGRKLYMTGELTGRGADGALVEHATSRATFISFDPDVWASLARST